MYDPFKKLLTANKLILVTFSFVLTACGGASSDAESNPPAKPGPVSSVASSATTISSEPVSSSAPTSSSTQSSLTQSSSSKTLISSAASSYVRVSRASSSARQTSSSAITVTKDTTPPANPHLLVYEVTDHSITLMWDDASDDTGVRGYEIRRNGIVIASPEFHINRLTDEGLSASTNYNFTISTIDLAGNTSGESSVFLIRTLEKKSSSSSSNTSNKSSASSQKVSNSSSNVSKSPSSFSSARSSSGSSLATRTTKLQWSHPNTRVSGKYLELHEIGGYSIRYRKRNADHYDYVVLSGNQITNLTIEAIPIDSIIEIATVDSDGLYSQYIDITPLD